MKRRESEGDEIGRAERDDRLDKKMRWILQSLVIEREGGQYQHAAGAQPVSSEKRERGRNTNFPAVVIQHIREAEAYISANWSIYG
jgi:hypothetical protein